MTFVTYKKSRKSILLGYEKNGANRAMGAKDATIATFCKCGVVATVVCHFFFL
jgi:hypothetical protein